MIVQITCAKVGNCQAPIAKTPVSIERGFFFARRSLLSSAVHVSLIFLVRRMELGVWAYFLGRIKKAPAVSAGLLILVLIRV